MSLDNKKQNQDIIHRISNVLNIRQNRINYLNRAISSNRNNFKSFENKFINHQIKLQRELDYCNKQLIKCKNRLNELSKNLDDNNIYSVKVNFIYLQ